MDDIKKAAEILVKCGYATSSYQINKSGGDIWLRFKGTDKEHSHVDLFAETLEGRRQADAIEDWLWEKQTSLWDKSFHHVEHSGDGRKMRLDRIKWCLEQL